MTRGLQCSINKKKCERREQAAAGNSANKHTGDPAIRKQQQLDEFNRKQAEKAAKKAAEMEKKK